MNPEMAKELAATPTAVRMMSWVDRIKNSASSAAIRGGQTGGMDLLTRGFVQEPKKQEAKRVDYQAALKPPAIVAPKSNFPAAPATESIFAVPPKVLDAVKKVESGGNEKAVSKAGAKGPYQLMDETGKEYHKKLNIKDAYDPFDEKQARKIADAIIADNLEAFDGDLEKALTAYHSGQGNVKRGTLGPEGRKYAKSVFAVLS